MPPVRVEFTVPQETYDRIEAARGLVPRAAWIKRAIQDALPNERAEAVDAVVRNRKSSTPPPVSQTWAR